MKGLYVLAGFLVGVLIITLLFSTRGSASSSAYSTSEIHALSGADDVQRLLRSGQKSYVLYHATWCGHCQTLKPMYEKMNEKFPNHVIAHVNCATHDDVPQKFGIEAFPCIRKYNESGVQVGEMMGARKDEATVYEAMKSM